MPCPAPDLTAATVVVCDVESDGLHPGSQAVEIAWLNRLTGERGCFVPPHKLDDASDPYALDLNGYWARLADQPHDDGTQAARLHVQFAGQATLAGSNPRVDAGWIGRVFQAAGLTPDPWKHRLYEIGNVAYGTLGLWPHGRIPGLKDVCEALGIETSNHEAAADVEATDRCITALETILDGRRAAVESRSR